MNVPTGDMMYLCQVSITALSDGDAVVEYSRTNLDSAPVPSGELDAVLLRVFGDRVIGHRFEHGVLRVMVAELPQQEDLETAIDQLFG